MSDQPGAVRYPPPTQIWDQELDAIERSVEEETWEEDVAPPATAMWLVTGREPTWHSWLVMLLVPIAALSLVGLMFAAVG